jgi:hypothetical protein
MGTDLSYGWDGNGFFIWVAWGTALSYELHGNGFFI